MTTVRFEGKPLDEKTLRGVHNYFNIYMLLLTLSVLLLSLDGSDLVTTFTSVATCLNNVGPGLEMVGPMGSFADFSAPAKLLLAFDMLAGRLAGVLSLQRKNQTNTIIEPGSCHLYGSCPVLVYVWTFRG